MSAKNPLNVILLSNTRERLEGLLPVLVTDIYGAGGEFHTQGLYSTEIFGALGTNTRLIKHSFIDVRTTIMHPKVYNELTRIKGLYGGLLKGTIYAVFDPTLQDFVKSDIVDGETGYSFFMKHFSQIKFTLNDSITREERIKLVKQYTSTCMYRYIVVMPAGLRDITTNEEGRIVEDDINGLYRKMIRQANTISLFGNEENSPVLDTVRWNLQNTFNQIYDYIESLLSGKKGLLLGKWASRVVQSGTRNVITAMDVIPKFIGAKDAIGINHTAVGLHQFMKSEPEISIYCIKNSPIKESLENLPSSMVVVDKKTWHKKVIQPTIATSEKWASEAGIEKLITGYAKLNARHKPILADDNYMALLYRDKKSYKVFYDIDELPEHLDKGNVKPITWTEMFYIAVYERAKELTANNTRYPISTVGSIYPSFIYLQTTAKTENLLPLDDDWVIMPEASAANAMPILGEPFYDSMSIHHAHMPSTELNADLDGDVMSFIAQSTDESIQETTDFLYSKDAYINAEGGLRYGVCNTLSEMVLYNMTRGLIKNNKLLMRDITPSDKRKFLEMRKVAIEENPKMYPRGFNAEEELNEYEIYSKLPNKIIIGIFNGELVGNIRFYSIDDSTGIFGIVVLNKFQNLGYGSALIRRLIEDISFDGYTSLQLDVELTNKAQQLYTKLGFVVNKEKKSSHKDHIRMVLNINEEARA